MRNLILLSTLVFLTLNGISQTISDVDGNTYNTVTIGTQLWMKENLRTTRLNDSTSIPNITGASAWSSIGTPAYCTYNNTTNADFITTHGLLYNWYTVDTKKLCPVGWHVPTDEEWTTLTTYLGGEDIAGVKMKDNSGNYWKNSNSKGDNSSGFTALPGGVRYPAGEFGNLGGDALFQVSNKDRIGNSTCIYIRQLMYNEAFVMRYCFGLTTGMSVRCIGDEKSTVGISDISYKKFIHQNPVSTTLNLCNIPLNAEIKILRIDGKLIKEFSTITTESTIDVSSLPNGIYLLKVESEEKISIEKFIKQ